MSGNDNETKVKVLIACENEGKKNADIFSEIYNKIFEVEYSDSFETAVCLICFIFWTT